MATPKKKTVPDMPEMESLTVSEIAAVHGLLADLSLPLAHPQFAALTHARPALEKMAAFLTAFNELNADADVE